MTRLAVVGGTGMNQWPGLEVIGERRIDTPYGAPSAALSEGRFGAHTVFFLPRHGVGHKFPPHRINYRANLWALREAGVRTVVAIAAVGSIERSFRPSAVAVPHDVIDYTWGREHTFSDGGQMPLAHADFSAPYDPAVRKALLAAARQARVKVVTRGVMGVTQGPRLESPAEIRRLKRDGCTMVGMTGMPEAALARELDIAYAALAVSVNWAAGLGSGDIHGEIERYLADGMAKVRAILARALPALA